MQNSRGDGTKAGTRATRKEFATISIQGKDRATFATICNPQFFSPPCDLRQNPKNLVRDGILLGLRAHYSQAGIIAGRRYKAGIAHTGILRRSLIARNAHARVGTRFPKNVEVPCPDLGCICAKAKRAPSHEETRCPPVLIYRLSCLMLGASSGTLRRTCPVSRLVPERGILGVYEQARDNEQETCS